MLFGFPNVSAPKTRTSTGWNDFDKSPVKAVCAVAACEAVVRGDGSVFAIIKFGECVVPPSFWICPSPTHLPTKSTLFLVVK